MEVYKSWKNFSRPENGCVLTVGNFDGVHLGHRAIIQYGHRISAQESLPLIGMTFEPAPVRILHPEKAPAILSPLDIKIKLLSGQKLDQLIVVETTREFLALDPEEFIKQILQEKLGLRHIVEGETFNFGRRRSGTMMNLMETAEEFGFQAHLVPAQCVELDQVDTINVSSTLIREQITRGEMDSARKCLGHKYMLAGKVVRGKAKGRELGFPTVNLELADNKQLICPDAVYAGYAQMGENIDRAWSSAKRYIAAISIGGCETFSDGCWKIEAHLLDYPADGISLYGQSVILSPVKKIRVQKKFRSPELLAAAIEKDCQEVRKILTRDGA